jgi:DNA invertase Pin-like site-specific DNA recombinase
MSYELLSDGAASDELARLTRDWWIEAADKTEIDLAGFDPDSSLDVRCAWALGQGLDVGTIYARYSSTKQHSTSDQVRTCVQHAAAKGIYCPPEFICADEAQRGYKVRRKGLDRMLAILKHCYATVMLVFKASRLFRQAFKGYQLIQQEVVEEGKRAISVTQGIDTADTKAWKMLFQVHGMVDDMVIEATADHVRAGLKGLFARGYTVGALPVGYRRKEVPSAPQTNRGLTRTVPEVDPEVAKMIREHYHFINDGMPIRKGWQKWVADGGPADPRSKTGRMTYPAYRRMLSRSAYTGRFEFGRKRNEFSTKRDYARQVVQPDGEVEVFQCDDLQIVDDGLFFAVQRRLTQLKTGVRSPTNDKRRQLWDLVTDVFYCPHCEDRYYQTGAGGRGMQCKHGSLCPCTSAVRRKDAVCAVCTCLGDLIAQDAVLIEQVICRAVEMDARGDDELRSEVTVMERKVASISNRINDLCELAGQGSEDDRKEVMARVRSAQAERTGYQHELCRLRGALAGTSATITPEVVRKILADFRSLLEDAAASKLGEEAIYKAVAVFRRMVGGRILVYVEPRPGRKQTNVRGTFHPDLLGAVKAEAGVHNPTDGSPAEAVKVWLRKPPFLDRYAERAYRLVDVEGHSYRGAAKVMRTEGLKVNSGKVWQLRRRYYEMIGETPPDLPYNGGEPRQSL